MFLGNLDRDHAPGMRQMLACRFIDLQQICVYRSLRCDILRAICAGHAISRTAND